MNKLAFTLQQGDVGLNDPGLSRILNLVRASNKIGYFEKQSLEAALRNLSPDQIFQLSNLTSGLMSGTAIFVIAKFLMGKGMGGSIAAGLVGAVAGMAAKSLQSGPKNSFGQDFQTTHNNFGKRYFIG